MQAINRKASLAGGHVHNDNKHSEWNNEEASSLRVVLSLW